ncbi:7-deoxyloganetin glucosyltransferase-like [Carya illinoinensis]|uniref:7-deoxyloganetin glucosyltransferase-like n=1 Tax=Carya illinoinensis TaxID=32201 RepID=UPI001C721FD6|nr:7-deoxyloganetin glucosyltransferase-like [Carya illinoinensis]
MEIDCNVKRDEVEKLVRELIDGEKGKEMRKHAMKWKKMAEETIDESHFPNGCMDTTVDWIPGIKSIHLKDLSSFLLISDPKDILLNFILEIVGKASKASAIVVNTFDALECEGLDALSFMFPLVYSIGPLHLLLSQFLQNNWKLNNIGFDLWKDEADVLIDSKESNLVIYVNFGSVTILTPPQMVKFACESKKAFIWVIRPNMMKVTQ